MVLGAMQYQPAPREVTIVLASLGGQLFASSIAFLCLYFLPSIIALARKVRNTGSVVLINLFLGWTLIGWVVALAMAAFRTRTTSDSL
jgi:hypothetical protein